MVFPTPTYSLARAARSNLYREGARKDHNLLRLVAHANLLDSLTETLLASKEQIEEKLFYTSLSEKEKAELLYELALVDQAMTSNQEEATEDWEEQVSPLDMTISSYKPYTMVDLNAAASSTISVDLKDSTESKKPFASEICVEESEYQEEEEEEVEGKHSKPSTSPPALFYDLENETESDDDSDLDLDSDSDSDSDAGYDDADPDFLLSSIHDSTVVRIAKMMEDMKAK